MKLDDIAASIGLRAETVSRCISKLEEQQLITRLGQGKLKVTNRSKLSELYNSKNIDLNLIIIKEFFFEAEYLSICKFISTIERYFS